MKIQPDKPISSTHRGASVAKGERMVINPGSVGQPRDNNPLASYSVIHSDGQKGLDVTNHRVGYDIAGAQTAMQAAGMHPRLVDRIRNGT
jgi:diadenosine tetraphosphatase ApaH/serine/threonine PP2A family protein phosphatase